MMKVVIFLAFCAAVCYAQFDDPTFSPVGGSLVRQNRRDGSAQVYIVPYRPSEITEDDLDANGKPRFFVDLADPIATYDIDLERGTARFTPGRPSTGRSSRPQPTGRRFEVQANGQNPISLFG